MALALSYNYIYKTWLSTSTCKLDFPSSHKTFRVPSWEEKCLQNCLEFTEFKLNKTVGMLTVNVTVRI